MIVNVNPYDTGYDENSHVMKFAALAREVYVQPVPAPVQRVGPGKSHGEKIKELGPLTLKDPDIAPKPYRRKVTISTGGPGSGRKSSETVLEVLEGRFRVELRRDQISHILWQKKKRTKGMGTTKTTNPSTHW